MLEKELQENLSTANFSPAQEVYNKSIEIKEMQLKIAQLEKDPTPEACALALGTTIWFTGWIMYFGVDVKSLWQALDILFYSSIFGTSFYFFFTGLFVGFNLSLKSFVNNKLHRFIAKEIFLLSPFRKKERTQRDELIKKIEQNRLRQYEVLKSAELKMWILEISKLFKNPKHPFKFMTQNEINQLELETLQLLRLFASDVSTDDKNKLKKFNEYYEKINRVINNEKQISQMVIECENYIKADKSIINIEDFFKKNKAYKT